MSKYDKRDQDKQLRLMEVCEDVTAAHNARHPARKSPAENFHLRTDEVLDDLEKDDEELILH